MPLSHRQRILNVLTGQGHRNDCAAFFPDLSYWFEVNKARGTLPQRYASCETLIDLHRQMDVGLPVHLYREAYRVVYDESVRIETEQLPDGSVQTITTPVGTLRSRRRRLMDDESPFRVEHPVKTIEDLRVVEYMLTHRRIEPTYDRVEQALAELGDIGFVDLVLPRSPLPLLLIDLAGIETGVYLLMDHTAACERLFELVAAADDEIFKIMAGAPGTVCIFGDNVDEVIVPPEWFRRYSLPYYQRRCEQLHRGSKLVSVHMDGRLRGLLPMVKDTGIDILDGTTPAPMNDFTLDEMLAALGPRQRLWCGVPATMFCDATPTEQVCRFGRQIVEAFGPRVVLNVGDQLPPDGRIERVEALAEVAREFKL